MSDIYILIFLYFIVLFFSFYKSNKKNNINNKNVISCNYNINRINTKNKILSKDNTVYMTEFKQEGKILYFLQILNGYKLYFLDPINLFCLFISFGQIYYYNDYRTIIPLLLFSSIYTFIFHLISINNFIKEQDKLNKYKHYKRGDIIEFTNLEEIPADILLIENSKVLVEELELTGEDVVIAKCGLDYNYYLDINSNITINHYCNTGFIIHNNIKYDYNKSNILFRGTKIIDYISEKNKGIVIETGNDCHIFSINNKNLIKVTDIQNRSNKICIINLNILTFLCCIFAYILNRNNNSTLNLFKNLVNCIILLNTVIPLSLQFFINSASFILKKYIESNYLKINNNGINSYQNDIKYIVSDKTGTITKNEIILKQVYPLINSNFYTIENILLHTVACSEIQIHSKTKELLKTDILEKTLIEKIFNKYNSKLLQNNNIIHINNEIYTREYYKPFDYKYNVKISVTRDKYNKLILHLQGTEEAIIKYSSKLIGENLKDKINSIYKIESPLGAYKRIICSSCKEITEEELKLLKENKLDLVLKNVNNNTVYLFYDYLVKNMNIYINQILDKNKDFTLLTGDKKITAYEIANNINMIENNKFYYIQTIDDLLKYNYENYSNNNICYIIYGGLFNNSEYHDKLMKLINSSNRRIIYRATPHDKQKYIEFLQNNTKENIMMIGDGLNDMSAIIQSNIGIAIKNNSNVEAISDITISNWMYVPYILDQFAKFKIIINSILSWVFVKHISIATYLVLNLIFSNFTKLKDDISPFQMMLFNAILFLGMCYYVYFYEYDLVFTEYNYDFTYSDFLILSIFNGCLTCLFKFAFNIDPINYNVFILLLSLLVSFNTFNIVNIIYYSALYFVFFQVNKFFF